jgi:transposase
MRIVACIFAGMRTRAAEWSERVRAWRESGQSAPAFAEGKGFLASTLRWWGSELARRERETPRVRLARVVRALPPAPRPSTPLMIAVGAARIEVRSGFDRGLLRDVVDALGAAR